MSHISSTKFGKKSGFTLVELVVSIGIMGVILTTVVLNQSTYTTGAALKQVADDISLSLRQAQVYGISVSQLAPGQFDTGYGIEFRIDNAGSKDAYILFADKKNSNIYNYVYDNSWSCNVGDMTYECLQKTVFSRGNTIEELCSITLSNVETCNITRADITFLRPTTDAHITLSDGVTIYSNMKGVRIRLISPDRKRISVVVYTTGQISVK